MIGQALSLEGKRYNVIILAGGNGSRLGEQSDYIPKALSQIGSKRAIDYIIEKYTNVAHKFIIGTCKHADLLETYIKGRFPNTPIEFSREDKLVNNFISTMYCLDHADTRYGTILLFCDLIVMSNSIIKDDTVLVASKYTEGNVGSFRHTIKSQEDFNENAPDNNRINKKEPILFKDLGDRLGILGYFIFGNTRDLKAVAYGIDHTYDVTGDLVNFYKILDPMKIEICDTVYEFGTENDLQEVRKLWENM
jgi:GTP:adenosylcobinamide-phosphate guanylyltransferase